MLGHIQNLDNFNHLNNGHFCSKRECTYLKSISEDTIGCLKRKNSQLPKSLKWIKHFSIPIQLVTCLISGRIIILWCHSELWLKVTYIMVKKCLWYVPNVPFCKPCTGELQPNNINDITSPKCVLGRGPKGLRVPSFHKPFRRSNHMKSPPLYKTFM